MNPISLAWVPFLLAAGMLAVGMVAATLVLVLRAPHLDRFNALYKREQASGRRTNLRITLIGWGSLLVAFSFSVWSLFRFAQLLNALFGHLAQLSMVGKLLGVGLPFVYVLVPLHTVRFTRAMVLLAAPPEGVASQSGTGAVEPRVRWREIGLWRAVDAGLTLVALYFSPSAFKWVSDNVGRGDQLWAIALVGVLVVAGVLMGARADGVAWSAGTLSAPLMLLAKLAVVLALFALVSTLAEVDLIEVALFGVLAGWVALGAIFSAR